MITRLAQSFSLRLARYLPPTLPSFWQGQLIGLGCALAGALTRFALEPLANGGLPVVVFYPFILIASAWGGTYAGILALILGDLIANYFWLPPSGFDFNHNSVLTLSTFSVASAFGILLVGVFRALIEVHIEAEERAALLAHETRHRSRNLLSIVQAIALETARHAANLTDFQSSFSVRLRALGQAQDLVSDSSGALIDLHHLVQLAVQPFGTDRFLIDGPPVAIPSHFGSSCALILYELGTNATKYGALSVPAGKVALTWQKKRTLVNLNWRELNGPPVVEPTRSGFGTRLLKTAFPAGFGRAALVFNSDGVHCSINLKISDSTAGATTPDLQSTGPLASGCQAPGTS
jgi:two-component sensor histidine kinase